MELVATICHFVFESPATAIARRSHIQNRIVRSGRTTPVGGWGPLLMAKSSTNGSFGCASRALISSEEALAALSVEVGWLEVD